MQKTTHHLARFCKLTPKASCFFAKLEGISSQQGVPTSEEINLALVKWIKYLQSKHYVVKPNGKLELNNQMQQSQLNPKIDDDDGDGIIMCHGRFINVDLPEKTKTPTLVPRNERKVHLLVDDYHKKLFHAGVNHTLSQIRTTY